MLGNSVGEHYRCYFCSANFSLPGICCYDYCFTQKEQILNSIMRYFKTKDKSKYGISFLPGILLNHTVIFLSICDLENYQKAPD